MAKKDNTVVPKMIDKSEWNLAAKYFTLSNVAMLHFISQARGDLQEAFRMANEACVMEVGTSLTDELLDWSSAVAKGDVYVYNEWQKVRKDYVHDPSNPFNLGLEARKKQQKELKRIKKFGYGV